MTGGEGLRMTEGEGLAMTQKRWGISPTSGKSKYLNAKTTPLCPLDLGFPLAFELWTLFGIWILAFEIQSDTAFTFQWHFQL